MVAFLNLDGGDPHHPRVRRVAGADGALRSIGVAGRLHPRYQAASAGTTGGDEIRAEAGDAGGAEQRTRRLEKTPVEAGIITDPSSWTEDAEKYGDDGVRHWSNARPPNVDEAELTPASR